MLLSFWRKQPYHEAADTVSIQLNSSLTVSLLYELQIEGLLPVWLIMKMHSIFPLSSSPIYLALAFKNRNRKGTPTLQTGSYRWSAGDSDRCSYLCVGWWSRTGRILARCGGSRSWTGPWPGGWRTRWAVRPSDPGRSTSLLNSTGWERSSRWQRGTG